MISISFNNIKRDNTRWDVFKLLAGVKWYCAHCDEETDEPRRAPPFRRAEICCGNCDGTLTMRTGGGQNDEFNWIAKN